jgi:hypothetical protein
MCCASTRAGHWSGWGEGVIDRVAVERWVAWVRLGGAAFALLEVGLFSPDVPSGYRPAQWSLTAAFGAGAVVLFVLARNAPTGWLPTLGVTALVFDTAVVAVYAMLYSYEYGNETRWALILIVVEAALRYGLAGGVAVPLILVPFFWFSEWWRSHKFGPPGFVADRVSFPAGILLLTGLFAGWLVRRLQLESRAGLERAGEAERLRDVLGRRVDLLEAANRSARALGSSLDIEQALSLIHHRRCRRLLTCR